MVLTIALVFAWISILCFACLPRKMPAVTNVLLYMGLAIIDINKLTFLSFEYKFIEVSDKVPEFLAVVINRDVTFSMAMLVYANAFWSAATTKAKMIASVCTLLFVYFTGQVMRMFKAMTDVRWGIVQEVLLICSIMIISLLLARLFHTMTVREEQRNGNHHS